MEGGSQTRICVVTDNLATLHYLAADVESRGQLYRLLHGGMNTEDRVRSLAEFTEDLEGSSGHRSRDG